MFRRTGVVFAKEMVDATRDRRSLLSGLFYAVWGPLVMALALVALARDRDADPPLRVPVAGGEAAASLVAFLQEQSVTVVDAPADVAAAIRQRTLPVAIAVDPAYPADFQAARPASVSLIYDGSWRESSARAGRVRRVLEAYGRRTADLRLVVRGIDPAVATPLIVVERDVSTAAARAATVLSTLPIFLIVAAFVGGLSVAADSMAGERERGSLEALLLNPVPRGAFVLGKWAAAAAVNVVTVVLTLGMSAAVLRLPSIQAVDLPLGLSPGDLARALLVLLPLALMVPALQLLLALFARSYKEAQSHLTLLLFVPMLPGFLLAFGTIRAASWMERTPVAGHHLLLVDLLRGQPAPASDLAVLALLTLGAMAAAVVATAYLLGREKLVRGAQI